VVIVTAQNTLETAVEAMKRGALDYLAKPFPIAQVSALTAKALHTRALEREVRELRREIGRRPLAGDRLVGKSASLLEIFKLVGRVAKSDVPVLVTGESGVGKELVARAIHAASERSEGPFAPVNAAAIPRELLESELFGHERGAFTGAVEARPGRFREASGGTLFLDEIGDMAPELQAKLLRVLQSGEVQSVGGRRAEQVDVRIVAATHRDLDAEVAAGRFREDLLYRLRVVPIHVPPLRERREDIPLLVGHFLRKNCEALELPAKKLSSEAMRLLETYSWPGNVRELENLIERAVALSASEVITAADFPDYLSGARGASEHGIQLPEEGMDLEATLERVRADLMSQALARTGGVQTKAAELLGMTFRSFRYYAKKAGLNAGAGELDEE
jgi:DNA-binding NtrC family response regulator